MLTTYIWKKGKPFNDNASRAEMLAALKERDTLIWVDLEEPTEFESDCLVEIFNFHPLAIEDCLVEHSQPKIDDYDEYLFIVMHAVRTAFDEDKEQEELITDELAVFLGKNFVVTFHRVPIKTTGTIREVGRRKPDRFMGHGADLLVHTILDRLVDGYQPLLDQYDDKIDKLEEEIFNNPPDTYLSTVMQVKHDIFLLKRIVTPQRDTLNYLARHPTAFIRPQHAMYYRDIYDHLLRIYSLAEGYHENLSSILQAYFSYSSHKLNEVVKHMTVLATLSMPAVIVSSIYGMNFQRMPGLQWQHGFIASLVLAGIISIVMLVWMKWKKWL